MIIDNERSKIRKGDIILTKIRSVHDIVEVKKKLKFIVIEIFRK